MPSGIRVTPRQPVTSTPACNACPMRGKFRISSFRATRSCGGLKPPGRYARGNTPVEGAVMNFRPIGRMPLGHVAVVTAVIDSRTILVTQANWIRGAITNDVTVQDVSPDNDWSQVQVELGDSSMLGASYPVYGFIYNQPDNGMTIANANAAASTEVAEAPNAPAVQTDAPDRNLQ